ncbi:MAG TPA: 3-hydroxyacyl-CoA dehydrogenase family protein [Cyclobacteriaceae bacterium]|nr:3-hydroxyacyl-CoA dehydrogenase family protein [Cyclobacteriaceae bacterium]
MKLAVLANDILKQEWLSKPAGSAEIAWTGDIEQLTAQQADVYFDLEFEFQAERVKKLAGIQAPVFINSVVLPLLDNDLSASSGDGQFIRINAWPTFLQRELTEVAIADPFAETTVREVFNALGWKCRIVPDVAGMISPRVIAMIINEAYFTLQAGVSSKEEIDTAMKLGTNYPFGPFEWSHRIGLKRIHELLATLSKTDKRYQPSEKLIQDIQTP